MWSDVAAALAHAFLAGDWAREGLVERGGQALGRRPRWLRRVVSEVLSAYHRPPRDRRRELAAFIGHVFDTTWGDRDDGPPAPRKPPVRHWFVADPAMARSPWPVPIIPTVGDLADFLDLPIDELLWLADRWGLERTVPAERLRNYRYSWLPRPSGPPRLIERPKARLKAVQRRILRRILDAVPPDEAAHGFRPGRSARSHAASHTGQRVVLRFDLEDFFASVPAGRVFGTFRAAGYPEDVAHALTALCTNVVPRAEWERAPRPPEPTLLSAHHRLGRRLATPHLPQGAPTSPALANLAAFRLDRRLAGLAASLEAAYTRYADDLALSGGERLLARAAPVGRSVGAIAREEGFRINDRKTRLMSSAGRQRLCGVVVNVRPNLVRGEYDLLRAVLHDAAVGGPGRANRAGVPDFRAHLLGRIAWAEQLNPDRGAKLRRLFDRIDWERDGGVAVG
jgi:RNA-directed DNA polymerase